MGLEHAAQFPVSSLHSNDEPASDENWNDAEPDATVPDGPLAASDVSGSVVSTVQVRAGGDASALPRPSLARTEKVCDPSESPL